MQVEEHSVKAGLQVRYSWASSVFMRPILERVWLPNGQPKIGRLALIELDLTGWGTIKVSAGGQQSAVHYKSWIWPGRHKIELAFVADGWVDISYTNIFGNSRTRIPLDPPPAMVEPIRFDSSQLVVTPRLTLNSTCACRGQKVSPMLRSTRIQLDTKVTQLKVCPIETPKPIGVGMLFKPDRLRAYVQSERFSLKIPANFASPMQLDELLRELPSNSDSHPKENKT